MYSNVGRKMKGLATALCWIGVIASVISGIIMISAIKSKYGDDFVIVGLIYITIGCLASWLAYLFLCAIGELVDNSGKIANCSRMIALKLGCEIPDDYSNRDDKPEETAAFEPDWNPSDKW